MLVTYISTPLLFFFWLSNSLANKWPWKQHCPKRIMSSNAKHGLFSFCALFFILLFLLLFLSRGDIPNLSQSFVLLQLRSFKNKPTTFSEESFELCLSHSFPQAPSCLGITTNHHNTSIRCRKWIKCKTSSTEMSYPPILTCISEQTMRRGSLSEADSIRFRYLH